MRKLTSDWDWSWNLNVIFFSLKICGILFTSKMKKKSKISSKCVYITINFKLLERHINIWIQLHLFKGRQEFCVQTNQKACFLNSCSISWEWKLTNTIHGDISQSLSPCLSSWLIIHHFCNKKLFPDLQV